MNKFIVGFMILSTTVFPVSFSWGWADHNSLMPAILSGLDPETQQKLGRTTHAICTQEDHQIYTFLIHEFSLNPHSHVLPTVTQGCNSQNQMTWKQLFSSGFVDDPDLGMDQNLPQSTDPKNDRKWMGGNQGPTSQGFRHMFFGGWKPFEHPLTTFQTPLRPLGQAPERIEIIANKAKIFLQQGQIAWGIRLLMWASHYLQDLAQPFHSAQIIHFKLVPWKSALVWPPSKGFSNLVQETSRVVANYHYAYENYTLSQIIKYEECLKYPEEKSNFQLNSKNPTPHDLALAITKASIELAPQVGQAELEFFGKVLFQPHVNLPEHQGDLNYDVYALSEELSQPRKKLFQVSCKALANASLVTRQLIYWALNS